jgi:hypothetical protein
VGQFEPGSPISRLGREPDWQAMVIDHLKMNAGPATFGAQVQAARGLLGWTRARLSNARKRRGALLPHQAPDRAARADRYTERVEVLLLASDGKPKHPARPADDARHMRTLGRRYPNRGIGRKSHGMV